MPASATRAPPLAGPRATASRSATSDRRKTASVEATDLTRHEADALNPDRPRGAPSDRGPPRLPVPNGPRRDVRPGHRDRPGPVPRTPGDLRRRLDLAA